MRVLVTEGVWRVSMTTSNVSDAWTEGAEVGVVMCGDKCDSSVQPLTADDSVVLRRSCTADFVVHNLLTVEFLSSLCYGNSVPTYIS